MYQINFMKVVRMQLSCNLYVSDHRTHFYAVSSVTSLPSLASLAIGSFEYLIKTSHIRPCRPTGSGFFVSPQLKQDPAGSVMNPKPLKKIHVAAV